MSDLREQAERMVAEAVILNWRHLGYLQEPTLRAVSSGTAIHLTERQRLWQLAIRLQVELLTEKVSK